MIYWLIFLASFVLGSRSFKLDDVLTAKNMGVFFNGVVAVLQ